MCPGIGAPGVIKLLIFRVRIIMQLHCGTIVRVLSSVPSAVTILRYYDKDTSSSVSKLS